ncbi:putative receptor-like protein kinase [Canna indica]|uniref:non-specific serine/threonine protein kinase n=1 Tax=Canna indica TaxID=4628 RepID=A0AAQ3JSD6_9LILI|nr:putative receptor-like protein kinase [Canna indica]
MACFGCFGCFKKRPNGAPEAERNSAPAASTGSTRTASSSIISRSDGSAATTGKQSSLSVASTASQKSIPALYEERAYKLRAFEFDELRNATNDFSRMNKIGEGGFGRVYKGYIKNPNEKGGRMPVAIKKLNQKGLQGHKQWLAEVQFLAVFEHPNLVKLIGYCAKDSEIGIERLLVYEFMPNKSLEDHLFNRAYPPLTWNLRLQIALGVAQGLAYLHDGEVQVIYRDFKASNVLLDKEFKPKLSDFGLAREGPTAGHTHVTTAVVGTYGYAAPDYIETGHLTVKSDVWSFGVVLYEILAGRRSLERNRPPNEQRLLDWVKQFPVETRKFSMIIDPRLRSDFSLQAAREIAKLANSCLVKNPKERPTMSEVVECLRRAIQMEPSKPPAANSNRTRTVAVSSRG